MRTITVKLREVATYTRTAEVSLKLPETFDVHTAIMAQEMNATFYPDLYEWTQPHKKIEVCAEEIEKQGS